MILLSKNGLWSKGLSNSPYWRQKSHIQSSNYYTTTPDFSKNLPKLSKSDFSFGVWMLALHLMRPKPHSLAVLGAIVLRLVSVYA